MSTSYMSTSFETTNMSTSYTYTNIRKKNDIHRGNKAIPRSIVRIQMFDDIARTVSSDASLRTANLDLGKGTVVHKKPLY